MNMVIAKPICVDTAQGVMEQANGQKMRRMKFGQNLTKDTLDLIPSHL
jgi:hypothetical protein